MQSGKEALYHHLTHDFTEPIRDPLWHHIYLSKPLKKIVSGTVFQKLGAIRQLGPAYLVYPGATHTRLNHSLGVFYLAKRMILTILNAGEPNLTIEGIKAFLCASLLHDLGHFPYAHSLKELPLRTHESLTAETILSSNIATIIEQEVGTDPQEVAKIVDTDLPDSENSETRFYRRLLSGVLDPDKLDYLNRDAYFCGVPYGIQDIDFIYSKLVPLADRIALLPDGLPAVEHILFSKYLMYRNVYWHRAVRIATAMIKKAVYRGLSDGIIDQSDLYGIDDDEFFRKFSHHYFPSFRLVHMVADRNLYKTAYETTFREEDETHRRLMDLDTRTAKEREIASELTSIFGSSISEDSVIIDIPEPISFEIDLPILHPSGVKPFLESDSVFDGPVVRGFRTSLRMLRIFVPEQVSESREIPFASLL